MWGRPSILTLPVESRDYPLYQSMTPRSSDVPGYILLEQFILRGIRSAVPLGCACTTFYFYFIMRPRLPFADRPLQKLHHYFFPSAAYSTPIGVVGGGVWGTVQYSLRNRDIDALYEEKKRDEGAAKRAFAMVQRRKELVTRRLRLQQSWWTTFLVAAKLQIDPVPDALHGLFADSRESWEECLPPYSLGWVSATSFVTDSGRYKASTYKPPSDSREAAQPPPSPTTGTSQQKKFEKIQVDHLVSSAMRYRCHEESDRWTRSAGRFASCGVFSCLLLWNSGNFWFRATMGLGLGVTAGGMVSALKLDEVFKYL